MFLNFLYDTRVILQEMYTNAPCSFPSGGSNTYRNVTIGFYGKHPTFLSDLGPNHTTKLFIDSLKKLIDM